MVTDIEIAQQASPNKIIDIALGLGLSEASVENYGQYKAKIDVAANQALLDSRSDGKLILVTAISPTPAGEGKTTTTVGLGDALNRIGKRASICLREPSLGPVFGKKGGAAGGGYAQVVPMEDINLHFTGDFAAIALAHNLLAAMIDNHLHYGNALDIDPKRIQWRRVMDMNDRALRQIRIGLGGTTNADASGAGRDDGFDIVVASEVMAILCLADSLQDLKTRLANIVIGYRTDGQPVTARQLKAHGAMTVLLKHAIKPNLVQTLERTPAFIHGGPFANIAHGCNSVIATRLALKLSDYVVTEAGFGADLGAEKFIDIKCRKSGLRPDACVIVATIRALKFHGGIALTALTQENLAALGVGLVNLEKHVYNIRQHYGLPCVVAINRFADDTEAEFALVRERLELLGVDVIVAEHWAKGSVGAVDLAHAVVEMVEGQMIEANQLTKTTKPSATFVYQDTDSLWDKMRKVATNIYGAADIRASSDIRDNILQLQASGYGHYPICVAKTQYSFSTDPALLGAPQGHIVNIREVRLNAGAEFIVMICGDIMTMPGLPRQPGAERIDIDDAGRVIGLF